LQDSLEQFDLSRLVEDVSELYIPAAEEAGFVLSVEVAAGPVINANRQLIGQAISNICRSLISATDQTPISAAPLPSRNASASARFAAS
jgi:signal transduction histidine kinase